MDRSYRHEDKYLYSNSARVHDIATVNQKSRSLPSSKNVHILQNVYNVLDSNVTDAH